jgi:hypothetical protein
VVVDRTGADLTSVDTGHLQVAGSASYPLHKSGQGGWSQRRYEDAVEGSWDRNAADVAGALTDLVDRTGAEVVVVAGDVRARQLLVDRLPKRIAELVVPVDGSRASGSDTGPLDEATAEAVAKVAGDGRRAVLDRYRMDVNRHLAVDGLAAVTDAARAAGVGVLLLADTTDTAGTADPGRVWIDPATEPATAVLEVATDQQVLRDLGVDRPVPESADAALLAAAAVSDAEAVTVPADEQRLADGVGAILRYPT